jgi:hypothetical protein
MAPGRQDVNPVFRSPTIICGPPHPLPYEKSRIPLIYPFTKVAVKADKSYLLRTPSISKIMTSMLNSELMN